MFKRRHKRSFLQTLRAWMWPRGGWGRAAQYMGHRIGRIPDTPFRIAAGFACGAAVSFTPFMGVHILVAIALAFVIRANMLAATVGTVVGNPWTFPIIWAVSFEVGNFILSRDTHLPLMALIDVDLLLTDPWEAVEPVFLPMLVGGFAIALVAWVLFYSIISVMVGAYQARRRAKIKAKYEGGAKP